MFKTHLVFLLKGMGMGAANVIPGVSGGTIALITGIFERIINALKSFDGKAIKLLFQGKFRDLLQHIDFFFLASVFVGMVISVVSLARIFEFLFDSYPIYIWSFFFGLILASIYFVGKTIDKWKFWVFVAFAVGTIGAALISFINPASPNDSVAYLVICGVVAICSMILPGISGSFVLILMGNYELIMIHAVNDLNLRILLPAILGGLVGLVAFSHLLSWVFKRFKNETIALLMGFVLGSLSIIWPWKHTQYRIDGAGNMLMKNGKAVVQGYELTLPNALDAQLAFAVILIIVGILSIVLIEKFAAKKG